MKLVSKIMTAAVVSAGLFLWEDAARLSRKSSLQSGAGIRSSIFTQ